MKFLTLSLHINLVKLSHIDQTNMPSPEWAEFIASHYGVPKTTTKKSDHDEPREAHQSMPSRVANHESTGSLFYLSPSITLPESPLPQPYAGYTLLILSKTRQEIQTTISGIKFGLASISKRMDTPMYSFLHEKLAEETTREYEMYSELLTLSEKAVKGVEWKVVQ